jgi:hypothetical protein
LAALSYLKVPDFGIVCFLKINIFAGCQKKRGLKNKRHISKIFLHRLLLFAVVITAASLFDHFNKSENFKIKETKESSAAKSVELGQFFYFNPVKISDVNRESKESGRRLFFKEQAKFLQQHHNSRILRPEQHEANPPGSSGFLAMNKALIKQIHSSNPDDIPLNS